MSTNNTSVAVKLKSAKFKIDGKSSDDWQKMVDEINIIETLDFPCMRMTIAVNDSVGMIDLMKGNEMVEIVLEDSISKKSYTYIMRIYRLGSRNRFQKNDRYVLECVSNEFIFNETVNLCKSFKEKRASELVKLVLEETINTKKKLAIEKTKDEIKCVVPNWRPFDFFNWLGTRAVRDSNKVQAGFIFYENFEGFHFKSFDKIIQDAKKQKVVFTYTYGEKKLTETSTGQDIFSIQSVVYPNVFDSLVGVRNGHWAGAFISVSLDYMENSKMASNGTTEIPYTGKTWKILDSYDKMEHLGKNKPYLDDDPSIKAILSSARRIRYRPNQLHLWDEKEAENDPPNVGAFPEKSEDTAIYAHCRKVNFEAIKLKIAVPGNLGLFAGHGVKVVLPNTLAEKGKIKKDDIYSGTYIIAGVRHKYSGGQALTTELDLVRDSLGTDT
jgi:hypothetical protein